MDPFVALGISPEKWDNLPKNMGYYNVTFIVPPMNPIAYVDTINGRIWAKANDVVSAIVPYRTILTLKREYSNNSVKNASGRKAFPFIVIQYNAPSGFLGGPGLPPEGGNESGGNSE